MKVTHQEMMTAMTPMLGVIRKTVAMSDNTEAIKAMRELSDYLVFTVLTKMLELETDISSIQGDVSSIQRIVNRNLVTGRPVKGAVR